MSRMPADAFEHFVALGPSRSYSRLAQALGVSKRSVTARARKEGWQQRLLSIDAEARTKSDQKLAETTAAINDRHLRTLRAVQAKALQALTTAPTGTAAQASATLIAALRAERAIVAPPDNTKSVIEWREVLEGVKEQRAAACRKESALPPPVPAARIEIGEN